MSHAGWLVPKAVHLCLPCHEHLPMNHEAQIHTAGENLHSHLQSHWGRCSPVVQQQLVVPLSLSSVLGSKQTGLGHGDVVTLPREDEHPSCTITSISSICSSAFPLQLPLSCINSGDSDHPQNGGTTHMCPGKGITNCPGVSV